MSITLFKLLIPLQKDFKNKKLNCCECKEISAPSRLFEALR